MKRIPGCPILGGGVQAVVVVLWSWLGRSQPQQHDAQLRWRACRPQWTGVNTNSCGDQCIPNQGEQSRGRGRGRTFLLQIQSVQRNFSFRNFLKCQFWIWNSNLWKKGISQKVFLKEENGSKLLTVPSSGILGASPFCSDPSSSLGSGRTQKGFAKGRIVWELSHPKTAFQCEKLRSRRKCRWHRSKLLKQRGFRGRNQKRKQSLEEKKRGERKSVRRRASLWWVELLRTSRCCGALLSHSCILF